MRTARVVLGERSADGVVGSVLTRDLTIAGQRWSKGRRLSTADVRRMLLRNGYRFSPEFLKPISSREIIARVLRNLIQIYQRMGASEKAERGSTLVEILLTRGAPRETGSGLDM